MHFTLPQFRFVFAIEAFSDGYTILVKYWQIFSWDFERGLIYAANAVYKASMQTAGNQSTDVMNIMIDHHKPQRLQFTVTYPYCTSNNINISYNIN